MVFTGLSVALFSQATGTEATINYIPEIMRDEAEIRDTQSDLLISMTVACAQVPCHDPSNLSLLSYGPTAAADSTLPILTCHLQTFTAVLTGARALRRLILL